MGEIIKFNPYLKKYRDMWREDRFRLSSIHVKLNIKNNKGIISDAERMELDTIEQVIEENGDNWLDDGYKWINGELTRT